MPSLNVKGLSLPFKFGPLGHANRSSGNSRIAQNLKGIALTKVGERIREGEIGTIGYTAVFRNLLPSSLTLIASLSTEAMNKLEPRAHTYSVTLTKKETADGNGLYLNVPYYIKGFEDNDGDIAMFKVGE